MKKLQTRTFNKEDDDYINSSGAHLSNLQL